MKYSVPFDRKYALSSVVGFVISLPESRTLLVVREFLGENVAHDLYYPFVKELLGELMILGLVSVVMPSFNSAQFINRSIDSVLTQSWVNLELIVVDDASSDNTCEIVRARAVSEPRIKLISCATNGGAASARNRAIAAADGQYLAFLDSDDTWAANKLEFQIGAMTEKGVSLSCTGYSMHRSDGRKRDFIPALEISYTSMLSGCDISCPTVVVDLSRVGRKVYMRNIRKRQDYLLWIDIMALTGNSMGIPEVLATVNLRNGSLSSDKRSAAKYQWMAYRIELGLSLPRSIYYFIRYAINGVRKYSF